MSTNVNFQLYVTNVDSEGPFLKLTGQIAKKRALDIEEIIRTNRDALEKGAGTMKSTSLSAGLLCIAQYQDGGFYRAKITNLANIVKGCVGVNFIDYGNNEMLPVHSIRAIPQELMGYQPQASDFLLSRIIHKGGRWESDALQIVSQLVRYKEMPCVVELRSCNRDFIRCHIDQCPSSDLSAYLTDNHIGNQVTVQQQECLYQELRAKATTYNPYHLQSQMMTQRLPPTAAVSQPPAGILPSAVYPRSDFATPAYVMSPSPESVDISQNGRQKATRSILPPRPLNRGIVECSSTGLPGFKISGERIISSKSPSPVKTLKRGNPSTYKSRLLALNSRHEIDVSFAKDGPELFAIQLRSDESALGSMIDQINRLSPESLAEPPMIGSVCLGRFSEDNSLRRAVVMGLTGTQCKLFFVDFGMTDLVSYYDIFYIPEELVIPCVFSLRFCLSGIKNLEITEDIKKFFYEIVTGKVVTLVVVAPEGPPLIQYGELFLNGRSVKDILIQKRDPKLLSFHPIPPASVIGEHSVLVSFVDSCTKFFVQLSQNIDAMTEIMNDVSDHCAKATPLSFHEVTCGLVCCALFPDDQSWYRAQVISIKKEKITVKYVDYGNEQEVTADLLRPLNADLIKLRSQGIHCALKGYENKPFDQITTNYLETLTLEKILRIKVCKLLNGDVLLVELYDDSCNPPVNVAKQIEQLCLAQSQPVKKAIVKPISQVETEYIDFDENPPEVPQHTEYKKRPEKNYYDKKNQSSGERTNSFSNDSENKRINKYDKTSNYNKSEGGSYSQEKRYDNRQESSPQEGRYRDKNKGQKNFESRDKYSNKKGDSNKNSQNSGFARHNQGDKDQRFSRGGRNQNNEYENDNNRQYREPYKGKNKKYASSNSGSEVNSELDAEFSNTKSYDTSRPLNNPAPFNTPFEKYSFNTGTEQEVNISWFINPNNFYVHILTQNIEFKNMMLNIPNLYKDVKPTRGSDVGIGSSVLARFPEDSVLYRAEVLKMEAGRFLVHFVDFGNKCLVDGKDLWQLEQDLMSLPKMAVKCSLSDTKPVDNEWKKNPDVNTHFSAPSYKCIFKSLDSDEVYSVSLLDSNGTNVKDTLVEKKLAISTEVPSQPDRLDEPLDFTMLIGQYFSAYVKNIESISNIYIYLNSYRDTNKLTLYDQTLECILNNYEEGKSKQLFQNDELILLLKEKNFIVYVNGGIAERLKITLYDPDTTEKIKLFEPDDDEGFKQVSVVCPHPVYHKYFGNAYISHIESLDEIYLQSEADTDIITELLDLLYTYYEENGEASTTLDVGNLCAVQSDDGNWYRSKILQVDSDKCLVQFIDYGNKSSIALDKVRTLMSDVHDFPQLCQSVKLGVPADDETLNRFMALTEDKKLYVVLLRDGPGWKANISVGGVDVVESMFGKESQQEKLPASTVSVLISHIDSPGQFWLQLLSEVDNINNLQADIQALDSLSDLTDRDVGRLCIAKYSGDDQFYRAIILDADSDITTVRFIDYGNTDVLDNGPSLLKSLTAELENIPPYAVKCSVNATPTGTGQWTEQAAEEFTRLLGNIDDAVEADFVLKDVTAYVDVYVGGQNVTKKLVEAGHANPAETSDGGELATCFASHVSSPSEFWIQLESSIHDLEAVSEELVDAAAFAPLGDIEEEVICAAAFPEDGQWYRAQVIINGTDGTEVLFMDYGNAALANELRSLPDSLRVLPALSRKCALQKPSNIKNWSKDAEMKFVEMAADGATIFQIVFIASGDISIVDLFINGTSVTSQLVSLCEVHLDLSCGGTPSIGEDDSSLVMISHCNCPEDFWVHSKSFVDRLAAIEVALRDAEKWDVLEDIKEGATCVSLFPEDGLWYRSKILDRGDGGTEVQYIDYGNTSVADKIRVMPPELIDVPPLARHCSLLPRQNSSVDEKFHEKFAELAAESCELRMEIVDSDVVPMTVKLYLDGEDIVKRFSCSSDFDENIERASEPVREPAVVSKDMIENFEDEEIQSDIQEKSKSQEEYTQENIVEHIDPIVERVEQKMEDLMLKSEDDVSDISSKVSDNITTDVEINDSDEVAVDDNSEIPVIAKVDEKVIEQFSDTEEDIHEDIVNTSDKIEIVENICITSDKINVPLNDIDSVSDKIEHVHEDTNILSDKVEDVHEDIVITSDTIEYNFKDASESPDISSDEITNVGDLSIKEIGEKIEGLDIKVTPNFNSDVQDKSEPLHRDIVGDKTEDVHEDMAIASDKSEDNFKDASENPDVSYDENIVGDIINPVNENMDVCNKEIEGTKEELDSEITPNLNSNKKDDTLEEKDDTVILKKSNDQFTCDINVDESVTAKNGNIDLESESSDKDYEDVSEEFEQEKTKTEDINIQPSREDINLKEETADSTAVDTTTTEEEHDDIKSGTKKPASSHKKKSSKGKKKAK